MDKGYAEGPAAEEAQARLDALELGLDAGGRTALRAAVYGSTADKPERHFLGWADEVDTDALFSAGKAWGITVVRVSPEALRPGRPIPLS
jgi:hypothetical protein